MKKILCCLLLIIILATVSGCNTVARHFGGTIKVNLPAGRKLVNCNWDKADNLWYITRQMKKDESAETYKYQEDSNFGIANGDVIITEHK